jgi:enoyl-CoA hydratase
VKDLLERYAALGPQLSEQGVLLLTISNPGRKNALDAATHELLSRIWVDVDREDAVRAVVITGADGAFCAGGDLGWVRGFTESPAARLKGFTEARDLIYNMINCSKPIVSAINGPAVGAGLAIALLADISVAGRSAKLSDGHVRIGVCAGDHAVILWPLLCGMARAKYWLLLGETITGEQAADAGLVSLAVDDDIVLSTAQDIGARLAAGSAAAVRWTKQALNNWLRLAGPSADAALALEFLGFAAPDAVEGLESVAERRPPHFT